MNELWINLKLNETICLHLVYKIIYKKGLTKLPKYAIIYTERKREDKTMTTTYERTINKLINNNIIIEVVNYEVEALKLERNLYYAKIAQDRAIYIIKEVIKKEIEKMGMAETYNINAILNEVVKGIRRKAKGFYFLRVNFIKVKW